MKLYATVISDRATKGQGGNDWIVIELTVQNGERKDYPIGQIMLDYKNDDKFLGAGQNEWVLSYLSQKENDPKIIDQGNVEPPRLKVVKGEKKKGEKYCTDCGFVEAQKGLRCKRCAKQMNYSI